MRFDFALLADAAQTVEGKLYVLGGGLTRVTVPAVPWMQTIGLCMRFEFDPGDDFGREYMLELAVLGPDENPIFGPHKTSVDWQRPAVDVVEGENLGGFIALTLNGLILHSYGPHRLTLAVDDATAQLPFAVVPSGS